LKSDEQRSRKVKRGSPGFRVRKRGMEKNDPEKTTERDRRGFPE